MVYNITLKKKAEEEYRVSGNILWKTRNHFMNIRNGDCDLIKPY